MGCMAPYAQIIGTAKIYIAPESTAPPAITAATAPSSPWVYLGETDGDQTIQHAGELTFFRTNERQAPSTAVRGEEDVMVGFTLVETTYENYAYIINSQDSLAATAGTPDVKRLALRRGRCPEVYALLIVGDADSPYGQWPAYTYIPRVVSAAEPTVTRSKVGRAALEAMFQALEDTTQDEGDELGWSLAQTSAGA